MPHMTDPYFQKSLIYVCEHDSDGALGLIINKPIPSKSAEEILTQTGLDSVRPHLEVYFGGPVKVEMGLFLHDSAYETEDSMVVNKEITLSTNENIIHDIMDKKGPKNYLFTLGYAGWGSGQMEREIENGDWLVMPATFDFIFSTPDNSKWEKAAQQFGIDIKTFSGGTSGLA